MLVSKHNDGGVGEGAGKVRGQVMVGRDVSDCIEGGLIDVEFFNEEKRHSDRILLQRDRAAGCKKLLKQT